MSAVNITVTLRPDYHEWFPYFSDREMRDRLKSLTFAKATLLTVPNIRQAMRLDSVYRDQLTAFISLPYSEQRQEMKETLLHVGISRDVALALGQVPREKFAPPGTERYSYLNTHLPWDDGSCVSGPGLIALMLDEFLPVRGLVAEVGIGSGYHAACLLEAAQGAVSVFGFEVNSEYAEFGRESLERAGYSNIEIIEGNAHEIRLDNSRIDAAYCTAAGLLGDDTQIVRQLADDGVLQVVRPLSVSEFEAEPDTSWLRRTYGDYKGYRAGTWRRYACLSTRVRVGDSLEERSRLYDVTFVPLRDRSVSAAHIHTAEWLVTLESLLHSVDD